MSRYAMGYLQELDKMDLKILEEYWNKRTVLHPTKIWSRTTADPRGTRLTWHGQ